MRAVTQYLGSMGGYMLLALPLWLLFRTLWLMRRQQNPRWGRELLLALFALYLLGLASQTLTLHQALPSDLPALWARAMQRWENRHAVNLTPGYTIRTMWEQGNGDMRLINLAGNVLIFVPLGFLPPLLWRRWRHWWAALGLSAGVSLLIEFLQLFLGRSVDVDDLILNALGGLLGWLLFCLLPKKTKGVCGK